MANKTATARNAATGKRRVAFARDSLPLTLSGWAAPADAADADTELVLSLKAGSIRLGTLRRDRKRPDVNEFLGYEGPRSGFKIDDFGLAAFAEITEFNDFAIAVTRGEDGSSTRHPLSFADGADVDAEPLGCRKGIRKSVRLADLWLDSHRKLTLRFDAGETAARSVDAYQCMPGNEPLLVQIGPDRPLGGAISTVTFTLLNPFLPLLLVFAGEDGALDALDILPFPSLVRGGRHEAERLIAGHGGDDVTDTATVSAELLRGLRRRLRDAANFVSAIQLDPAVTTGLEPSVDEDLLSWLGDCLGLHLATESSTEHAVPAFIAERIAAHDQPEKPGHSLKLPADAIPTIASLVNAYRGDAGEQVLFGGFGVVDWNRHGRIWSVWQPPLDDWLDGFQLGAAARFAPSLHLAANGDSVSQRALAPGWPLALLFREQPTRAQEASPLEASADLPVPLLRNGAVPGDDPFSVVVLFDYAKTSPVALLESLARQESVGPAHVTICWPTGADSSSVKEALEVLFPDRHRLVEQPPRSSPLQQLVGIRELLDGNDLAILQANTFLTDSRTLATLLPMLSISKVVSAGCLIRSTEDKGAAPAGAGYSITGLDLRGTPAVAFETIDLAVFRGPATFPVVANSTSAMVAKARLLAEVEAFGAVAFRPELDDLLLGIHSVKSGGINLCTTIVSAHVRAAPGKRGLRPATIPYRISQQTLGQIADSATVVQRIR